MKQIATICAIGLFVQAHSGDILAETGKGNNFNGWYVEPFVLFSSMEFGDDFVNFTAEDGGEISIELMKKIPAMAEYDELVVEFRIEELINSRLNSVSVFVSEDGLHWDSVSEDATYRAIRVANPDFSYKYLKAVANVTFFNNGKVRWSYTRVEGIRSESTLTSREKNPVSAPALFQVYAHDKSINIVSPDDFDFTVLITDMKGTIVLYETVCGNHRFDPDFPDGLYVVHILRKEKMLLSRKLVL